MIDASISLESSPTPHVRIGLDGQVLYTNRAMQDLSGRSSAELGTLRFRDLLTPAAAIFYETQFIPGLLLKGALRELSFDLLISGNQRTPVIASAVLDVDSSGAASSVLIAVFDATQRKQFETRLLKSRKEFEQLADVVRMSSDAIIRLDSSGCIASWNDGAKQLFNYMGKEILGRNLNDLLTDTGKAEIAGCLQKLAEGIDSTCETTAYRKDGHLLNVAISLTAHIEPPGKLIGFSSIIRDISARQTAERALVLAEKLATVGQLASTMAHEINNPLAAVTNLLYLLEAGAATEEMRGFAVTAQAELARVAQITTQTLRVHRRSSKKTTVSTDGLFQEIIALYRGRFDGAGIQSVCDSHGIAIEAYEGELRQILLNLVANSFDAMRLGGKLILRSRRVLQRSSGREGVRISVADDGTGITPEACLHLFEAFFSTKGINGAGLGLWISKDLVERNDGSIRIRSSTHRLHHGTIVSIFLPV